MTTIESIDITSHYSTGIFNPNPYGTLGFWERYILGVSGPFTRHEHRVWQYFPFSIGVARYLADQPWSEGHHQLLVKVVKNINAHPEIVPVIAEPAALPPPAPEVDPNDLDFGLLNDPRFNPRRNSYRHCRRQTKPYTDTRPKRK
jgi:hypothetical protein